LLSFGIEIPENDLEHLFQPFHCDSNVATIAGTGLGLVIAKDGVDLHAGTIDVESQLGFGTSFTVPVKRF
jgi:signal transduction histidine kinase